MRKKEGKKSPYILGLLAAGAFALTLAIGAVIALAEDTDKDGLPEAGAISLPTPTGLRLAAYPNNTSIPLCGGNTPRDQCIDPATKDLFVIIQRATAGQCPASVCGDPCSPTYPTGSNIPMPSQYSTTFDPLALVRSGGLGITTHELIQQSGYTSQAIGNYYAVKVIEDLNPCSDYMGFSTFGSFDGTYIYTGGIATVWPEKIKNWIRQACSVACFTDKNGNTSCYHPNDSGVASFACKNPVSGTTVDMKQNQDLSKLNGEFIQNIINHEVSHLIHLASAINTVDHHYAIDQGVLMEQYINPKATKDRNNNIIVNLNISTGYTRDDKTQFLLR